MVIGIRTLTSIDGVIGLNGYVYLEDNNGNQLTWQSLEEAKQYIENRDAYNAAAREWTVLYAMN